MKIKKSPGIAISNVWQLEKQRVEASYSFSFDHQAHDNTTNSILIMMLQLQMVRAKIRSQH
jgi:hypothetical protein